MRERLAQRAERGGFTLVELMIVVVIVAILALVAIPGYQSNVAAAKMSEGITGTGVIRTALRTYSVTHSGSYPALSDVDGNGLGAIAVSGNALKGKFFSPENYTINSSAASYTIRVTLAGDGSFWEVDEEGNVSKSGGL